MKRIPYILVLCLCAVACRHPEVEYVQFQDFQVTSVQTDNFFLDDGSLNPKVALMEDPTEEPETKVASTQGIALARDLMGVIISNKLVHIAGIYNGHDIDGSRIKLSGKLILPAEGPIKNLILVSHYTIAANFESPSETFPLEGLLATKGYAVAIADYIGYGITADRIHPYMHVESTARSVVDMGIAVKPYLKRIGRAPESNDIILFGYSQGGSTTMAVMDMIQDEYYNLFPLKMTYCGGGPYELAATFDVSMEISKTGIPCAIPMIVQGINEGERLGLDMADFFKPHLLQGYKEWINSKKYTVKQINQLIDSKDLREIMTDEGRNKHSRTTAHLYSAMLRNSTLNFHPYSPMFIFHSRQDETVPFINALKAEEYLKGLDVRYDFGDYGKHGMGFVRFLFTVYKDLP
jgi:pimeloyl-ACP methyl ester carboxylesterase